MTAKLILLLNNVPHFIDGFLSFRAWVGQMSESYEPVPSKHNMTGFRKSSMIG